MSASASIFASNLEEYEYLQSFGSEGVGVAYRKLPGKTGRNNCMHLLRLLSAALILACQSLRRNGSFEPANGGYISEKIAQC
jgi:hypothetical protein